MKKTLYILYCALIVPYTNYCVEVWGHTYKTNLNSIYRLQKKAVRIVKSVDYYEPTIHLFINLHAFKFLDLVDIYSLQLMYKVYNNLLPNCIQRLFIIRESQYNLRRLSMFKKVRARTNAKSRCLSVKGVHRCNKGDKELKVCNSLCRFKKMYKNKVINDYMTLYT